MEESAQESGEESEKSTNQNEEHHAIVERDQNYKKVETIAPISYETFSSFESALVHPEHFIARSFFPEAEVKFPVFWRNFPTKENFVSATKEIRLIKRADEFTLFATLSPRNIVMIWDPLSVGSAEWHSTKAMKDVKKMYVGFYIDDFAVPPLENEKLILFLHSQYNPFIIPKLLPVDIDSEDDSEDEKVSLAKKGQYNPLIKKTRPKAQSKATKVYNDHTLDIFDLPEPPKFPPKPWCSLQ